LVVLVLKKMILYFWHDLYVLFIIHVSKSDHRSLVRQVLPLVCSSHGVGLWNDLCCPWMVLAESYGYLWDFFYRTTGICIWTWVSARAIPHADQYESTYADLVGLLRCRSNFDHSWDYYTVFCQKAHQKRGSGCDIDFGSKSD
jgi:hypothetical protein